MTNKHYYEDIKINSKSIGTNSLKTKNNVYIYNTYIQKPIEVKFIFISENDLDISILKIVNTEDSKLINKLNRIKIDRAMKIKTLDEIYSLSFSYFSLDDMFKLNVPIYSVR